MISALISRASSRYWPNPYAPKPEPLQTLPELIERAKRARAEVYEMTVAADMNRGGA